MSRSGPPPRPGGARSFPIALVLLLGGLAAWIYTEPLARHATTAIPYTVGADPERRVVGLVPGDHLQFLYFLSLTRGMVRGEVPWLRDPYEFSAPEPSPRRNLFFLPFSLLFAALAVLGEPVAYNLLVWLSFPATWLAVYALGRRIGLDFGGALLAGLIATLLPYRIANAAGGHPSGFVYFLVPLTFVFLERAWWERRRAGAAAAGATIGILALNEPHFVYFLAFLLPAWAASALWRALPARATPRPDPLSLSLLASCAIGPTTAWAVTRARLGEPWDGGDLALLALATWLILVAAWRIGLGLRARADEDVDGRAEALSYLPLLLLGIYSVQLVVDVPYLGRALLLGVGLALVVAKWRLGRAVVRVGSGLGRTAAAASARALWPALVGFALAAAILVQYKGAIAESASAAGRTAAEVTLFSARPGDLFDRSNTVLTRLLYPGVAPVVLAAAGLVHPAGRLLAASAAVFTLLSLGFHAPDGLPFYRIAFDVVPFFGMIRQPAKFFAVASLALALAAGFGMEAIRRRLGMVAGGGALLAALAAVAVDFTNTRPLGVSVLPQQNAAYAEVATRGRGTNLLELPLWPGDSAFSSIYQYWASRTRVATVNGYSPTAPRHYVERVVRPLEDMNLGEMSEAQHRLLGELGVELVTLHRDTFPGQVSAYPYRHTLAALRANPNLEPLAADEGVYLFGLRPGPYRPWVPDVGSPLAIFFEAETLKHRFAQILREPDASGGELVRGLERPGDPDPFVYGPYRPFPRGRYRALFRVRGQGRVEVTAEQGRRVLAAETVDRERLGVTVVRFDLDGPTTLELRAAATATLDFDWVLVEKLSSSQIAERIEAEDLFTRSGFTREADGTSGGAVAVVVPSAAPPGQVVLDGPYRRSGPGRISVAARSRGGAAWLRVESADGRIRYAEIPLAPTEKWRTTRKEIELPRREILCTRLVSAGEEAELDYVILETRSGASEPEALPSGAVEDRHHRPGGPTTAGTWHRLAPRSPVATVAPGEAARG